MRKTSMLVVAGACLATLSLAVSSAAADPTGLPTFRELAGVGSDTTQGVMNALSNVVRVGGTLVIGSYDASGTPTINTKNMTFPACQNIARPVGSKNGINALSNSQTAGDGCLQFARSSTNDSATRPGANLTYIPFATDGLTYATRSSTTVPHTLTIAQLQNLYNCSNPMSPFHPVLPQFGSGTRAFFLSQLSITDASDIGTSTNRPCVITGLPENTGNLLFANNQLEPYSISSLIAQESREVADVHGTAIVGEVGGIVSLLPNPAMANGITYLTRSSTSVPHSLTIPQLQNLYNCVSPPPVGTFVPMLPANPSSTLRMTFLSEIGVTTPGSCVRTTDVNNNPLPDDQGNLVFAANQIMPYDISAFINQQSRTVADVHGNTILNEIGGTLPMLLNTGVTMTRPVFNVVPNGLLPVDPTTSAFVGPTSQVCTNTRTIQQFGFATNPNCGSTTITTPGNPALTPTGPITMTVTPGTPGTITATLAAPTANGSFIFYVNNNLAGEIHATGTATLTTNVGANDGVIVVFNPFTATTFSGAKKDNLSVNLALGVAPGSLTATVGPSNEAGSIQLFKVGPPDTLIGNSPVPPNPVTFNGLTTGQYYVIFTPSNNLSVAVKSKTVTIP